MNIGMAIRKCRKAKGLTLADVKDGTNLSQSYLSLIEKNERTPNLDVIESISKAIGVPVSVLLFLASDRNEVRDMSEELYDGFSKLVLDILMSDDAA
ncbi:MAG: helix-turn-helix transcriptional regulator [Alcanivoracaceae bacterium]|nr:helix-turn-helix transcriptional regulator [Alcanivoracaceae bacterium]